MLTTFRSFIPKAIARLIGFLDVSSVEQDNTSATPVSSELPQEAELFASICEEWDRAEEVIKLAQHVVSDVVIPAVAELRYAGRRIVDALNAHSSGKPAQDVRSLIEEAKFDCFRSRHDAIDAALDKMSIDLDALAKEMGYDVVHNSFPDFVNFVTRLDAARLEIANSRKNRQKRDVIYTAIINADFPRLVDDYKALRRSETLMRIIVSRKRVGFWAGALVGLIIAVPGWVMGWYFWQYPAQPTQRPVIVIQDSLGVCHPSASSLRGRAIPCPK